MGIRKVYDGSSKGCREEERESENNRERERALPLFYSWLKRKGNFGNTSDPEKWDNTRGPHLMTWKCCFRKSPKPVLVLKLLFLLVLIMKLTHKLIWY